MLCQATRPPSFSRSGGQLFPRGWPIARFRRPLRGPDGRPVQISKAEILRLRLRRGRSLGDGHVLGGSGGDELQPQAATAELRLAQMLITTATPKPSISAVPRGRGQTPAAGFRHRCNQGQSALGVTEAKVVNWRWPRLRGHGSDCSSNCSLERRPASIDTGFERSAGGGVESGKGRGHRDSHGLIHICSILGCTPCRMADRCPGGNLGFADGCAVGNDHALWSEALAVAGGARPRPGAVVELDRKPRNRLSSGWHIGSPRRSRSNRWKLPSASACIHWIQLGIMRGVVSFAILAVSLGVYCRKLAPMCRFCDSARPCPQSK